MNKKMIGFFVVALVLVQTTVIATVGGKKCNDGFFTKVKYRFSNAYNRSINSYTQTNQTDANIPILNRTSTATPEFNRSSYNRSITNTENTITLPIWPGIKLHITFESKGTLDSITIKFIVKSDIGPINKLPLVHFS